MALDVIRHIQERRKALDCQYTDRIRVGIVTSDADLSAAITEHQERISAETLATELKQLPIRDIEPVPVSAGDSSFELYVHVA